MDGRTIYPFGAMKLKPLFLLLALLPLLAGCYKDDVEPAKLTNNPFDPEYVGENIFVSDGTYTETVFIPGVGNVVRQVIAFHVRSELFLSSGSTYSVQVHDQQNGQTVLLNPDPPGGNAFKYYKQNLVQGAPVCLELRLSNNLSVARAETICVTL